MRSLRLHIAAHFAVIFTLSWYSTRLKLRVGLGSRILSLGVYNCKLYITFHVQAVVPVMLVKPTNTLPLASANISPLTNIPTSFSTQEVLKIVAPIVQKIVLKFWTLLPQASN